LQKACREGPDSFLNELGLSALQWACCLEEDGGCHEKMIDNIERLLSAKLSLASLLTLETRTLQKACRDGPDALLEPLALSSLQWASCLEEGDGSRQKMIDNVERLYAASEIVTALTKVETVTLHNFCRKGPVAPFDALGLSVTEWASCLEQGAGCHRRMIDNIERLYAGVAAETRNRGLAELSETVKMNCFRVDMSPAAPQLQLDDEINMTV
jgi:hypothetical protein